ncbi:UDP-N-acetylmuramate dehydrogenase [Enterococcus sp. BWT-B8]|uniref:UDP-N-acetylmuramate dehydrogenase n=1 Tax=Enterococcus sp. BWT-B8 TaxID=2885157 RepID=UPI001E5E1955|nr:UDP-N-acetylmuramate dehydrogenase [Enterococcus sp. BWT-B8]MCB5952252.1 UDP-N-acetylmuramate dehydrogenase [Enterococcus sp. BWT-B8]
MNKIKEKIQLKLKETTILFDEPLMNFTFTKTGGPADMLSFPKTKEEVRQIVLFCRENDIPWIVLGNASNLIVRDGGIRGMVIMLAEMNQVNVAGDKLTVDAGAKLIDTTYEALANDLAGFEFASGIPGSVGGAVFMNAGAYDGEIKDVFESVEILLPTGEFQLLTNEEMNFSYRHSALQNMKCIALQAVFALTKGDTQQIKRRMDELTELRQSKQPLEYPSCGSVFKRPEGHFTGKLIQDAGLQGLKWGGAQISEKHAGFIVNIDGATATDYVELIAHIQSVILEQFGVKLETEVRIIGEEK